ncbi:hypothetical protein [Desertifilum sp. FACHB-868]|uniref:hypothetical protein n=1 Tax=Desertifilum sp. FACHB-868 TaxID=2692797 RepID=UPI001688C351|nr:hypothetical protein [Desertifilum sp. FACHB-868]
MTLLYTKLETTLKTGTWKLNLTGDDKISQLANLVVESQNFGSLRIHESYNSGISRLSIESLCKIGLPQQGASKFLDLVAQNVKLGQLLSRRTV